MNRSCRFNPPKLSFKVVFSILPTFANFKFHPLQELIVIVRNKHIVELKYVLECTKNKINMFSFSGKQNSKLMSYFSEILASKRYTETDEYRINIQDRLQVAQFQLH